nr:hypothetical protein [Saccharothrix sp. 6-C]
MAADLDGRGALADDQGRRSVAAQHLLHGGGGEVGVGLEPGELVGVLQQQHEAVGDEPRGRLVAREQQQHAVGDDLVLGDQALALGADEHADEVLAGLGPALPDEAADVLLHLQHAALGLPQPVEAGELEDRHDVARPGLQLFAVGGGHAQHLGDHVGGQRVREVGDDVHPAAFRHRVEQFGGELADPGP